MSTPAKCATHELLLEWFTEDRFCRKVWTVRENLAIDANANLTDVLRRRARKHGVTLDQCIKARLEPIGPKPSKSASPRVDLLVLALMLGVVLGVGATLIAQGLP